MFVLRNANLLDYIKIQRRKVRRHRSCVYDSLEASPENAAHLMLWVRHYRVLSFWNVVRFKKSKVRNGAIFVCYLVFRSQGFVYKLDLNLKPFQKRGWGLQNPFMFWAFKIWSIIWLGTAPRSLFFFYRMD